MTPRARSCPPPSGHPFPPRCGSPPAAGSAGCGRRARAGGLGQGHRAAPAATRRGGNHISYTCRMKTSPTVHNAFSYTPQVNEILLKSSQLQLETAANITRNGNEGCACLTGSFTRAFHTGDLGLLSDPVSLLHPPCGGRLFPFVRTVNTGLKVGA